MRIDRHEQREGEHGQREAPWQTRCASAATAAAKQASTNTARSISTIDSGTLDVHTSESATQAAKRVNAEPTRSSRRLSHTSRDRKTASANAESTMVAAPSETGV